MQKGAKTYTEAKYESSELSRRLYRSASEAARRLEEWLRGASSFGAFFAQEVTHLRARLKDYCERLLFTAPLEYGRQAEELTWRKVYYDVVQHYKATKATTEEDSVAELRAHLHSGLGHYHHLLLRLQAEAQLNLETNVDVPLIWEYEGLNRGTRWSQKRPAEDGSPPLPVENVLWARQAAHRFLIALGDIARYLIELEDREHGHWAALSARYYWQALSLDPGSGMPHNQLGTLAAGDTCKAAYHFLRCLQSSQPFEGAQGNLLRLLDKNSSEHSPVGQLRDRCQPSALFTSSYLRLCEQFYTSSDTSGLQSLCEECLSQLTAVLEQPEEEAELVFQAAAMAIICTDKLHKSGPHPLSSAAAAFTLNMFSHVTATCCHLVSQCSLTGPERHIIDQGAEVPAVPKLLAESTLPQDSSFAAITNGWFPGTDVEEESSSFSPPLSSDDNPLFTDLARATLLPTVKMFCDWLMGRTDLIGPCTQARTPLWQHLASLFNLALPFIPPSYPIDMTLPDTPTMCPLPEDVCLQGTAALSAAHSKINWELRVQHGEECQLRLVYLVRFGQWLSERPGSGLQYTHSQFQPKVPIMTNGTSSPMSLSNDVLVVGGEGGGGGGDEKRKRVMRSMAHLWLEQEVRDLEGQLGQAGRQAAPPPFLVPHTQVLCTRLVHLRRLVASRRFVLVVPSHVIACLDLLKRESVGARESIRWLEGELRRGSRYVRSQKSHERLSLSPMKYPKRKEKEAWELFQILECCHHLEKQCPRGGHPADRPLVTLLVCSGPPGMVGGLPPNATALASSAGINMEDVEAFTTKWLTASVPRTQPG
ncbi:nonsense-mediated mRNA decay factor SMG5 isoform X1 [Rhipicephalus sanguineus]|uniref:nonsense-mediated mRNA decay factor SMG5 isoform X1 n=1 Tax=Rhipicephalus sanguineus TaxID=34632 RepID=UPI001895E5A0|nr:nonsense-mediated mRNA decay factor SMG5 isoform X1 [Rhipicephalus sanguineus]